MLKWISLALGLFAVTVGCGSGGDSGAPADGVGSPAPGGDQSSCEAGLECPCPSGLIGTTECDGGHSSCNCSDCPTFTPTPDSDFEACGGDVFGTWQLKSYDPSQTRVFFSYANIFTSSSGSCETQIDGAKQPEFLLDLRNGGDARVKLVSALISFSVLDSCVQSQVPTSCARFDGCTRGKCGVCSCTYDTTSIQTDRALWSRTGTVLSVEAISGDHGVSFDYCVNGDEIRLRNTVNKEIFTLSRVYVYGTPTPCANRPTDQCVTTVQSDAFDPGSCHVGRCDGTNCPSAESEADCTNVQGCTWNTAVCAGTPAVQCGLSDFGMVPGCVLGTKAPHCVGSAVPCSSHQTAGECSSYKGCTPMPGCKGTATFTCDYYVTTCGDCPGGCSCGSDAHGITCAGSGKCSDLNLTKCFETDGCTWENEFGTCEGTVPACDSLGAGECEAQLGCMLTAN